MGENSLLTSSSYHKMNTKCVKSLLIYDHETISRILRYENITMIEIVKMITIIIYIFRLTFRLCS